MDTTMNITNTSLRPAPSLARRAPQSVRTDALPRALFVSDVLARRLAHVVQDSFRGESKPAALSRLGTAVLVRSDREGDEVEAFLRLGDGAIALVDSGHRHVRVEVAAGTRGEAVRTAAAFRAALATDPPAPERVSIAFWMRGEWGGDVRHREIDAEHFDEIAGNYSAPVRAALEQLGRGGAYMLDVLTWDGDDEDRWRLLILEDAGELIAADARAIAGQALSRLLNVADGLLGQGTRTMLLITTNEPVGRLHPATRRAGRCLADIEFTALSAAEANAWLAARGLERRVVGPTALAELFGAEGDGDGPVRASSAVPAFGFARALD